MPLTTTSSSLDLSPTRETQTKQVLSQSPSCRKDLKQRSNSLSPNQESGESSSSITNGSSPARRARATQFGDERFELLILTEAGKPVYSYATSADDMVTLMGVCQALVNYVSQIQGDQLRFLTTKSTLKSPSGARKEYRITFATRSPLMLVVLSPLTSHIDPHVLITQAHAQMVSIFTSKVLKGFFENRATFDLRGLMSGSEKLLDTLIRELIRPLSHSIGESSQNETSSFSSSGFLASRLSPSAHHRTNLIGNRINVPVFPMVANLRNSVNNVIMSAVKSTEKNNILFSILFYGNMADDESEAGGGDANPQADSTPPKSEPFDEIKLVTVGNHNVQVTRISPLDIQLVWSLIKSSENQLSTVESLWLPLCLPRFNSSAFLHAHLASLGSHLSLVQLSSSRDDFHSCQLVKGIVRDRLSKLSAPSWPRNICSTPSGPLGDKLYSLTHLVWYQSVRQTLLWISPKRLALSRIPDWNGPRDPTRSIVPLTSRMSASHFKTVWCRSEHAVSLAWNSHTFQLYVQFDVNMNKMDALTAVESIVKWIKTEEEKISIKEYQH